MTDQSPDHYASLGVPPNADLQAIKKAYRMRALESHPDRGGSQAAMLRSNEAYEILSDQTKRRTYDEARQDRANQAAQHQATADSSWARQKAGDYPRDGKEFESWLDALTRDFA